MTKKQEGQHFQARHGGYPPPTFQSQADALLKKLEVLGHIWIVPKGHQPSEIYPPVELEKAKNWISEWQEVWKALYPGVGGGGHNHWIPETLRAVTQHVTPALPGIFWSRPNVFSAIATKHSTTSAAKV